MSECGAGVNEGLVVVVTLCWVGGWVDNLIGIGGVVVRVVSVMFLLVDVCIFVMHAMRIKVPPVFCECMIDDAMVTYFMFREHMHHYACIDHHPCLRRMLDNLASFGLGRTKTHGDSRRVAELRSVREGCHLQLALCATKHYMHRRRLSAPSFLLPAPCAVRVAGL